MFLGIALVLAAVGPFLLQRDPDAQDLALRLLPPLGRGVARGLPAGGSHWLGTDALGRDVLARLGHGVYLSFFLPVIVACAACALGTIVGTAAGVVKTRLVDATVMGAVELQTSVPYILVAIVIATVLGPGVVNLAVVLAASSWPAYARIARSEAARVASLDFVAAARAVGCPAPRLVARHIIPNVLPSVLCLIPVETARMILAEATLSFLGVGAPSEVPSWGRMLAESRDYAVVAWWTGVFPGMAVAAAVFIVSLIAARLAAAVDPVAASGRGVPWLGK